MDEAPGAFVERLKLNAALMMLTTGEISAGAACELAGVGRLELVVECRKRAIALAGYPPEELAGELDALRGPW